MLVFLPIGLNADALKADGISKGLPVIVTLGEVDFSARCMERSFNLRLHQMRDFDWNRRHVTLFS